MPNQEIRITNGPMTFGVIPKRGGVIARLDWQAPDGQSYGLLRAGPDDPSTAANGPRDFASFPLFPFSNRIENAQLHFDGEVFELPKTFSPSPHSVHGDSWNFPWEATDQSEHSITMTYESDRLGPPFDYVATQHFTLADDHLKADLTLTNKGTRSMPAGLGLHPYFEKTPGVTINATLPGFWLVDDTLIPTDHIDAPSKWAFTGGKSLDGIILDGNFTGWDGIGRINWPDRPVGLEISASENLRNVVIYVPKGEDYFCFEPVSNATNGMNRTSETWERDGIVILQPGESMKAQIIFKATKA